jgi:hypothetical protein
MARPSFKPLERRPGDTHPPPRRRPAANRDPRQYLKDGATIFGGFTGSTSVKYRQPHTKGTLPTGKTYECVFYDHGVEFTGIRVSP